MPCVVNRPLFAGLGKFGRSSRALDNGRSSRALATIARGGTPHAALRSFGEASPQQPYTATPWLLARVARLFAMALRALVFFSSARCTPPQLTQDPTFKDSNVASPKQCLQSDLAESGTDSCVSNPGWNAVALPHGLFTPALPRT